MTKQDIIIDSPKEKLEEDLFGWAPVVNRIADIIRLKSNVDHACFTIGVYGKWGEGKSTLMNMVCENLLSEENIKVILFNPWLFKDQESLLLDFFKVLQKGNISGEFVKKIKQYGPMVSLGISGLFNLALPGMGSLVKNSLNEYIDAVSSIEIDVTKLKEEVNESIRLSKKHLLIVIDDVDRLDKDELHALFKLIRQNADFINTTYMVAMDVDMVAKSIGQRFEGGDEQSGKNFLEKIIQVPFYLPKLQQGHIYKLFEMYLFPRLDEILNDSGASTTLKNEIGEALFGRIIPLFTTVREVIVYTNSLLLTLPLIYRDVNISDFCQLEALKLFHPKGYDRIRNGKHLITEPIYGQGNTEEEKERKITEIKNEIIKDIHEGTSYEKGYSIRIILLDILFPFIKSESFGSWESKTKKRLCTRTYFDKYFLYTTPDDIIGDTEIDSFIKELPLVDEDALLYQFEYYFYQYDYLELERIIHQVLSQKEFFGLPDECVGKICIALSRLSVNKDRKQYVEDVVIRFEITIGHIIEEYIKQGVNHGGYMRLDPDYDGQRKVVERILSEKEVYLFHLFLATYVLDSLSLYENRGAEINDLVVGLLHRFIDLRGIGPIFGLTPLPITTLFKIWNNKEPDVYKEKVDAYLGEESTDLVPLLRRFMYGMTGEHFNDFCLLFDEEIIYHRVKDIDPNMVENYYTSVGTFIEYYEGRQKKG